MSTPKTRSHRSVPNRKSTGIRRIQTIFHRSGLPHREGKERETLEYVYLRSPVLLIWQPEKDSTRVVVCSPSKIQRSATAFLAASR